MSVVGARMSRTRSRRGGAAAGALTLAGALAILAAGCGGAESDGVDAAAAPPPVRVTTVPVAVESLTRRLRVTGSLLADEQAEVSAEIAGRVVATPVERGTKVAQGAALVRLSSAEADAQLLEAEANAAQIEARLGLAGARAAPAAGAFDPENVPEVRNARAARDLAEAEFARVRTLLEQRVVSQSEFDRRRSEVEVARQQYESARNGASQQVQALEAARARVTLARKAVADTVVRAPFAGLVADRGVSVGDWVNRGASVATVVRVDPLRVELTVPEQAVARIAEGQTVVLTVDAYPGRSFEARVRFVSPTLRADQRALTVEAILPNADGLLKPGLFASAEIETTADSALVVPAPVVQTSGATSRLFVVRGRPRRGARRGHRPAGRRHGRDRRRRGAGRPRRADSRLAARRRHARDGELSGGSSHAMACFDLRQAPGVHLGAHPERHGRRRGLVPAAGRRPVPEGRLPDHHGDDAAPRRGARAGGDRDHRQDRGGASTPSAASTSCARSPPRGSRRSSCPSCWRRTSTSRRRRCATSVNQAICRSCRGRSSSRRSRRWIPTRRRC